MTITITIAEALEELTGVAELTRRFLEWDLAEFASVSGLSLSLDEYVSNTLDNLEDYMPPDGRIAMARDESGNLLGIVMLRRLAAGTAEIKRLFVDPEARGAGIGKKLVGSLLEQARDIGYEQVYLDTGTYMPAAHRLYRGFGFRDTGPYPGSENDETVQRFLKFMKLEL